MVNKQWVFLVLNIIISAHFPPKAPLARLGRDDYNKKRDIYKQDLT